MANANMNLMLSITGRDNGAIKLLQETERQLQKSKLSREQLVRANRPYAVAGIRSEREIQREIAQTQAAYHRLARSGTASQNDLARAAVATKNKIRELNNELNQGIETQSKWGAGLSKVGRFGAATAAGGMAAYSSLKPAMDNQKQLQSNMNQVARNAWVADASKSPEWIAKQGVAEVRALAESWIKQSGGTADAALGFMNAQMAQGLSFDEIKADRGRGYAGMTAMAQNGQYDFDGAASLYSVFKNAGLSGDKVSRAVEKTIQSGLDGKFEIADVVREAPALLSGMSKAGMTVDKDLDYMLAWMQSAANKSGSNSEAANNLSNTIAKASSSDLQNKVKKALNLDWKAEVLKGQGNGENSVQVLARLLNDRLSRDAEYQKYKQAADKGNARAAIQADTIRSMLVSKVMPDLQAQSGLLAAMDIAQMQKYMQSTQGTGGNKIDRINQARMQDMGAQQEKNQSLALLHQDALMNPLNALETKFTALAAEFPNVTEALKALAAAATAAALAQGAMNVLNKAGGGAGAAAGGAAAGAGKAGWLSRTGGAIKNGLSRAGGWLTRLGPRIFGGAGLMLYSGELNSNESAELAKARQYRGDGRIAFKQPAPSASVGKAAEPIAPLITQQTTTYQTGMQAQTTAFQAALQADTAAVSGKLDAINGTLAGVQQTIQLNSTLNLDGRIIANEVSRHAVAMFGRGAAQ